MNPMNHQHTVRNHLPSGTPLPGLWFLKSFWLQSIRAHMIFLTFL
jgi:hypothetical protein